jgi:hypothetical protein
MGENVPMSAADVSRLVDAIGAGFESAALHSLIWRIAHNAGHDGRQRRRWVAVSEATGLGSDVSALLCRAAGLDPDELVGRDEVVCRECSAPLVGDDVEWIGSDVEYPHCAACAEEVSDG